MGDAPPPRRSTRRAGAAAASAPPPPPSPPPPADDGGVANAAPEPAQPPPPATGDPARDEAVALLNDAKLAAGADKADKLAGLEELICRRRPTLLPEFVPELGLMVGEPTPGVRAALAGTAAEAAAIAARALPPGAAAAGVAAQCAAMLATLIRDGTPAVAKRAAAGAAGAVGDVARTAAGTVDGASYSGDGGDPADALAGAAAAWCGAEGLATAVCAVVRGEGEPGAGARAAAVKAAEGAALSLDALARAPRRGGGGSGGTGSVASADAAARLAGVCGAALADLLRPAIAPSLPGALAVAAVKAGASVAGGGSLPLAGRVLPALTGLAAALGAGAGGAEKKPGSTAAASLRAALRAALVGLYRSPQCSPAWRPKVGAALAALGAAEGVVDPADAATAPTLTRPADGEADGAPPAKRPRSASADAPTDPRRRGGGGGAGRAAAAAAPAPPADATTPVDEASLPAPGSWTAPAGLHPEIRTALARAAHLAALDGSPFAPGVAVFVASLPPALLADAVLECVRTLPPGVSPGPLGTGGLNALGAELVAAALRPPPPPLGARGGAPGRFGGPPPAGGRPPPPTPLDSGGPGAEFGVYAGLVVKAMAAAKRGGGGGGGGAGRAKAEEAAAVKGDGEGGGAAAPASRPATPPPITLPLPAPPGPAPPAFPLAALDMDARARREARRSAFGRLLARGGGGTTDPAFRAAALARLAAAEAPGEGLGDALVGHLKKAEGGEGGDGDGGPLARAGCAAGVDLALAWLASLAVAEVDVAAAAAAGARGAATLPPPPPPDGRYAAALTSVLDAVRGAVSAAGRDPDRAMEGLLLGAPHLPPGVARAFLADAIAAGGATATAALAAAHAVATARPPAAAEALDAVLAAATDAGADADVRSKAVRLAANRLLREGGLAAAVVSAAEAALWAVTRDWVASAAGQEAADAAADAAAAAAEEAAAAAGDGGGGGGGGGCAQAPVAAAAAAGDKPAPPPPPPPAPGVELYCALVTRRPDLLPGLLAAFGSAPRGAPGRAAIMRLADGLARVLGPAAPALAAAAASPPPPGSAPLLLKLLYAATEAAPAAPDLATALLARHAAEPDARLLPPALGGLARGQALALLPQLLSLPDAPLRAALHRLLMVTGPAPSSRHVPAAELLSAIMTTDPAAIPPPPGASAAPPPPPGHGLERLKAAVAACLAQPAIFDVAALSASLTHLAKRGTAEMRPPPGVPPTPLPLATASLPLPPLFMRTLIQALAAAPSLRPLVVTLLAQTAGRRPPLWEAEPAAWKGWLLAARAAAPDSFPVLVALPGPVVAAALRDPDAGAALRAPVTDYARSASCPVRVAADVLEALATVEAEARAARMAA